MKELFLVENNLPAPVQPVLLLTMGDDYLGYAVVDKAGNNLHRLVYNTVDGWDAAMLESFWQNNPVLQENYFSTQVAYNFCKSTLQPLSTSDNSNKTLLSALFGADANDIVITENIPGWQLQNAYAISQVLKQFLTNKLPTAKYRHQFTLQLSSLPSAAESGIIYADFNHKSFTTLIVKAGKLLLAQTFEYASPEDVIYYLLKSCQQFSLSQENVQLHLSGLIAKDSALYKELYNYFIEIDFRVCNWQSSDEYPAHFFTTINDLMLCV